MNNNSLDDEYERWLETMVRNATGIADPFREFQLTLKWKRGIIIHPDYASAVALKALTEILNETSSLA